MKKIALFIAVLMLATATLAFGASAETPGTVVDEVPANFGLLADFNPEAITEDLSGVIGDPL